MITTTRDGVTVTCDDGTRVTITPIGGLFGANVTGVDLSERLDPSVVAVLDQAFVAWHVLRFPDQVLAPSDELRVMEYFDDGVYHEPDVIAYQVPRYPQIQIVSNIEIDGEPIGYTNRRGMEWHSDLSGMSPPLPDYQVAIRCGRERACERRMIRR